MLFVDHDGTILKANEYARKLVGESLLIEKKCLHDVLVNFGQLPTLNEFLKTGETSRMLNVNTANGLPETIYLNFYKLLNYIIVIGQVDQGEIYSLRNNLLETNKISNNLSRELHKKNAQLIKLNELKNQFLGIAAHDLRNPISVIKQYSEHLLKKTKNVLEESQLDLLYKMKSSSHFMLNLLNDLLDISKIESGKLTLNLESINILELIEKNISLNQVLATSKGIKLVFDPTKKIPQVNIDPEKIEQVLNNLLSNAIKYSAAKTTVQINVYQHEDNLVVAIKDQGRGIAERDLSTLFNAFQTTSVKSIDGEKSTGLGLHIVQKIISGHQGRIWVESKVKSNVNPGGTTFFFNLPISKEDCLQTATDDYLSKTIELEDVQKPITQTEKNIHSSLNLSVSKSQENTSRHTAKKHFSTNYFLNEKTINEIKDIDPYFFYELLDMFLEQTPELITNLRKFNLNQDTEQLVQCAEQLQGSSASIGALPLAQMCTLIIEQKSSKDRSSTVDFLDQLESLFAQTRQSLLTMKKEDNL